MEKNSYQKQNNWKWKATYVLLNSDCDKQIVFLMIPNEEK